MVKKNENEDYVRNATILETSYEDNEEADNKVDETVHDIYDKKHDKGKKADCNATNIQNNNVAVAWILVGIVKKNHIQEKNRIEGRNW